MSGISRGGHPPLGMTATLPEAGGGPLMELQCGFSGRRQTVLGGALVHSVISENILTNRKPTADYSSPMVYVSVAPWTHAGLLLPSGDRKEPCILHTDARGVVLRLLRVQKMTGLSSVLVLHCVLSSLILSLY